MQHQEYLAARVRELVRTRTRVSEEEAYADFALQKSTASFRYVRLLRSWFSDNALGSALADLDRWAAEHKDDVEKAWEAQKSRYLPVCRKAHELLIGVPDGASETEKEAARKRVEEARGKLEKGLGFEEAINGSQDESLPGSGDLGCVSPTTLPKPVNDALEALSPGQISPVGQSDKGFFVVRLDGILRDAEAEAEGRHTVTRNLMRAVEGESKAAEAAKRIQALVIGGTSVEAAVANVVGPYLPATSAQKPAVKDADAKKKPLQLPAVEEAKDVLRDSTPLADIAPGGDVANVVFSLEKSGDVAADLVKLEQGYAVVQLIEKRLATRPDFEKVREPTMAKLLPRKQQDALLRYVQRLHETAKADIKRNATYTRAAPSAEPDSGEEP